MNMHAAVCALALFAPATNAQSVTGVYARFFDNRLAWTDSDGLVTQSDETASGIAVDEAQQRVFTAIDSPSSPRLISTAFDLHSAQSVVALTDTSPFAPVFDPASRHLYWFEDRTLDATIYRVNVDGGTPELLTTTGVSGALFMEIDFALNIAYISNSADIVAVPLDCSDPYLFASETHFGLSLDPREGNLYWTGVDGVRGISAAGDTLGLQVDAPDNATLTGLDANDGVLVYCQYNPADQSNELRVYNTNTGDPSTAIGPTLGGGFPASLPTQLEARLFSRLLEAQPDNAVVTEFGDASFSVVSEAPGAGFQWRRDGVNLENGGRFQGVNTPILKITPAISEDSNVYDCIVSAPGLGTTVSDEALLVVKTDASGCRGDVDGDGTLSPSDFTAWLGIYSNPGGTPGCD